MKKRYIYPLLFCMIFVTAFYAICFECEKQDVCEAFGVLDILSPKVIEFYEKEISHKQVVSSKSDEWLERTAQRYDISVQKARAVLIVKDFCSICNEEKSFAELASFKDGELVGIVKDKIDIYMGLLTEQEQAQLKQKAKTLFVGAK